MDRNDRLARTIGMIGEKSVEFLQTKRVAVFGLGGVGSACAESLCRGGIGNIDIIDFDSVSVSNLNRQLLSDIHSIGYKKTETMLKRIRSIAPDVNVYMHDLMFLPETENDGISARNCIFAKYYRNTKCALRSNWLKKSEKIF